MIKPPHRGETIKEDYLVPLGMSVNQLSKALGVGTASLNEIVRGRRGALPTRPCGWHGTLDQREFWLNLQTLYDLRIAENKTRARIRREITPLKVA